MLSIDEARRMAQMLVERVTKAGADAADAIYSGNQSTSVQVRLGDLEEISRSDGEEIGLRVFLGQKSATVASSDFADETLDELARRALAMAAEAPEDRYAGLAPSELLQTGPSPDVDSVDSSEPSPADLKEWALAAERAALAVEGVTNSSGASGSNSVTTVALATSAGFVGGWRATGYSRSATVIAGEGASMQRDHAWHGTRHLADLDAAEAIGQLAGERAVARLNPVKPRPKRMAVLFDPRVSASLLTHLSGAISGAAIARKSSFLLGKLGERIFAQGVTITDDPLRKRGLRSRPFDGEGLRVSGQNIVADGVLTTWLADSAAARQLGIAPTGHASRGTSGAPGAAPSNLFIAAGNRTREQLLGAFPEAILVTELIGQGVNPVTGDYSRGATGFMVRNGEIAEAVNEVTIAGNLLEMFATLEPAADLEFRRGIDAPTLLVPEMTVAAG